MTVKIYEWVLLTPYPSALTDIDSFLIEISDDLLIEYMPMGTSTTGIGFFNIEYEPAQFEVRLNGPYYDYLYDGSDDPQYISFLNGFVMNKYFLRVFDDYGVIQLTLFIPYNDIQIDYAKNSIKFKATNIVGLLNLIADELLDFPYISLPVYDIVYPPGQLTAPDPQQQKALGTPIIQCLGLKVYNSFKKGCSFSSQSYMDLQSLVDYVPANMAYYPSYVLQPWSTNYTSIYGLSDAQIFPFQYLYKSMYQTTTATSWFNTNPAYVTKSNAGGDMLINAAWFTNMYTDLSDNTGMQVDFGNISQSFHKANPQMFRLTVWRRRNANENYFTVQYKWKQVIFSFDNLLNPIILSQERNVGRDQIGYELIWGTVQPGNPYTAGAENQVLNDPDYIDAYLLIKLRQRFQGYELQADVLHPSTVSVYTGNEYQNTSYSKNVYNFVNCISSLNTIPDSVFDKVSYVINGLGYGTAFNNNPYLITSSVPLISYATNSTQAISTATYSGVSYQQLYWNTQSSATDFNLTLMFTGSVNVDIYWPKVELDTLTDKNQKQNLKTIISSLLSLSNAYLDCNEMGNEIKVYNKPSSTPPTSTVTIDDNYVCSLIKQNTLLDINDYLSAFNICNNKLPLYTVLKNYYKQVKIQNKIKIITTIVLSAYDLSLGDAITVYSKDYIITKIQKDYSSNLYQIEAMGAA